MFRNLTTTFADDVYRENDERGLLFMIWKPTWTSVLWMLRSRLPEVALCRAVSPLKHFSFKLWWKWGWGRQGWCWSWTWCHCPSHCSAHSRYLAQSGQSSWWSSWIWCKKIGGTDLAVGGAGLGTTGSFTDFPSNGSFSSAATTTTLPSSSTWLSELQTNLKFRLLFLQKLVCLVIFSYDGFPYLSTAFSTGHKLTQAIQLKKK